MRYYNNLLSWTVGESLEGARQSRTREQELNKSLLHENVYQQNDVTLHFMFTPVLQVLHQLRLKDPIELRKHRSLDKRSVPV